LHQSGKTALFGLGCFPASVLLLSSVLSPSGCWCWLRLAFLGAVWVLLAVSCTAVGFLLGVLLVVTGCGAWDRFRCCGASVLLLSVVD
jgi:Na+-transporting NADH:ubiquinone oxidoreductase subunit NqrB